MTPRLDDASLRELCCRPPAPYHMSDVACQLKGLARWWLKDEVRRLAATEEPWQSRGAEWLRARPPLPDTPGCCWVIFALERPDDWPALRPAFLVPLCWRPHTEHSPHLPPALRRLAREVVGELRPPEADRGLGWGLHMAAADGLEQRDISGLSFACESGKAALAAGLICAMEGARPDPGVWATGTWGAGRDPLSVERLAAKLELAHQWGLREFFVPGAAAAAADDWCARQGASMRIGRLDLAAIAPVATAEGVRRALNDYLWSLDVPPPVDLERGVSAEARAWYLRQSQRDRERALSFYWEKLLPVISRLCQRRIEEAARRSALESVLKVTHLVTIASDSPEVVPLVVRALHVENCLILYTEDKRRMMELARNGLAGSGCSVQVSRFEQGGNLSDQFRRAVSRFAPGVAPERIVLDLTPGTKLMSLTLSHQVAQPGNWLHYLRHEIQQRTVCPGSERPMLWRAGESWDKGIMT